MTAEAAAALIGTSTTILGMWEDRFGFPVLIRGKDGQRLYPDEMMIALRAALGRQFSVASAITEARRIQPLGLAPSTAQPSQDRCGKPGKPEEAR